MGLRTRCGLLRAEAETAAAAAAAEALVAGATTVTCAAQRAFFGVALQKGRRYGGGNFKVDRDGFRWRGGLDLHPSPSSTSRAQADDDRASERASEEAAGAADEEDEESPWAVLGGEEGCFDVRVEDAREARGMPWFCNQIFSLMNPPWVLVV
jgi:hypothetical protein